MSCGRRNAKDKHPVLNKHSIYKHLILQNTIMYNFSQQKRNVHAAKETFQYAKTRHNRVFTVSLKSSFRVNVFNVCHYFLKENNIMQ
jgi:hypothetical protein